MKTFKLAAICLSVLALASCRSITLPRAQTNTWLESKAGPSGINLSGIWDAGPSMGGGWGNASFSQDGNHFVGGLGAYSAEGVVNGSDVYMIISSGRLVYSAHLKPAQDGSFTGQTVYGAIIDQPEAQNAEHGPIFLRKFVQAVAEPAKH